MQLVIDIICSWPRLWLWRSSTRLLIECCYCNWWFWWLDPNNPLDLPDTFFGTIFPDLIFPLLHSTHHSCYTHQHYPPTTSPNHLHKLFTSHIIKLPLKNTMTRTYNEPRKYYTNIQRYRLDTSEAMIYRCRWKLPVLVARKRKQVYIIASYILNALLSSGD